MSARVIKREKKQADDAAVTRHPAFPNFQDRKRLAQHFRPIKQDVSESSSNHHAEKRSPRNKVRHALGREFHVVAARQTPQKREGAKEREHIGHAVPTRPEISPNAKDEGIKVVDVISEHRARLSTS